LHCCVCVYAHKYIYIESIKRDIIQSTIPPSTVEHSGKNPSSLLPALERFPPPSPSRLWDNRKTKMTNPIFRVARVVDVQTCSWMILTMKCSSLSASWPSAVFVLLSTMRTNACKHTQTDRQTQTDTDTDTVTAAVTATDKEM